MARRTYFKGEDKFIERLFALLHDSAPLAEDQVVHKMVPGKAPSKTLYRVYSQFRHEGWLQRNPEGEIYLETRTGKLHINPRGYGFVISKDHPGADVFVPERWLLGARHGDEVLVWVRTNREGPGPEGRIMNIVKRAVERVVGRVERGRTGWRVIPRDRRRPLVEVAGLAKGRMKVGDIAVANITEWPLDPTRPVRGEVAAILGSSNDSGIDIDVLLAEHEISPDFPETVQTQASRIPEYVEQSDLDERLDLRDDWIFTIDGSDAKDLDDAISVKAVGTGYEVGVHIADVSYYAVEDSPLDLEARRRGTSIYLVDRVVPMLPERLSNGIASLNPQVDRLTVSAFIQLDPQGRVVSTRFARSVIKSRNRLTYDEVNSMLMHHEGDNALLQHLELAAKIRDLLRTNRMARGAVDFEFPEAKVILNAAGEPIDVVLRNRGPAEMLIEEFMLLANEAVAHFLLESHLPGLFRVHDKPSDEKLQQFRVMVEALGYHLPKDVTPKALQDLISKARGTAEERVINGALLRSMRQAKYGPTNIGHFGLASKEYTHFTSPIRRYPDLWVHRVLTGHLDGTATRPVLNRWHILVDQIGEDSSLREREAMELERESVAIKEVAYMADKVGEVYDGIISGVTNFGVFVELPTLIEGLVRMEDLPQDYWDFDSVHYRLVGRRTGRVYRLGNAVTVRVARVDTGLKRIDFSLEEKTGLNKKRPPVPVKKKKRRKH